jgi:hypothetical protein
MKSTLNKDEFKKLEAIVAAGVGAITFTSILMLAVAVVVRAWCVTKLWLWFVVPLGLPPIGILAAIGLTLALVVLLGLHRLEGKCNVWQSVAGALASTTLGWLIHLWM